MQSTATTVAEGITMTPCPRLVYLADEAAISARPVAVLLFESPMPTLTFFSQTVANNLQSV
jgi:hypothetical protein